MGVLNIIRGMGLSGHRLQRNSYCTIPQLRRFGQPARQVDVKSWAV